MLHPSEFFKWAAIRTGIDVFEIFNEEARKKLANIHPKNFIRSKIEHPVYKITVSYETERGNYKKSDKYMVLNNLPESEYEEFWADIFVKDYEREHKCSIRNLKVLDVEYIGDAVLKIG